MTTGFNVKLNILCIPVVHAFTSSNSMATTSISKIHMRSRRNLVWGHSLSASVASTRSPVWNMLLRYGGFSGTSVTGQLSYRDLLDMIDHKSVPPVTLQHANLKSLLYVDYNLFWFGKRKWGTVFISDHRQS